MPEMNGAETLSAIRAADRDVPVFLLSGYAEQDELKEVEKKELSGFIHKPFTLQQVSQILRGALARLAANSGEA